MDAVGACGGGGSVAGGGTDAAGFGNGGATLGVDGAGGTGTFSAGAAAGGCGADATTTPSVAPISMMHNFCCGFTVSPSLTNTSFMTPSPGDGTGTEVCKQARLNFE